MVARKKVKATPAAASSQPEGDALGSMMQSLGQSLTHLPQISAARLAELQSDYLKQASSLWNAALGSGELPKAAGPPLCRRRLANQPDVAIPRAALPAQRPHAQPDGGRCRGRRQNA